MDKKDKEDNGIVLMDHEYDGIREYDQRLPNWWLFTLYGAILFSIGYWFNVYHSGPEVTDEQRLLIALEEAEQARSGSAGDELSEDGLWALSENAEALASGKTIYMQYCSACHMPDLKGQIGFNLIDNEWVHSTEAMGIYNVAAKGVLDKGMPAWDVVLGPKKVAEVTAYILSHHKRPLGSGGK